LPRFVIGQILPTFVHQNIRSFFSLMNVTIIDRHVMC